MPALAPDLHPQADPTVRPIDPDCVRADALHDLVRDVYTTSDQMSETLDDRFPDPSTLAAEIADVCRRAGALFLVAEAGSRPVGYLVVKPRLQARLRHTADLQIGVHSARRGQGIGRRLLDEALRRVEREDVLEIVYLMVRADNRSALALYAASGFERLATLQRDIRIDGRHFDGVLMRRFVGSLAGQTAP
jgi:ribosomal protein S18 acetylase RimI-like enzyme